MPAGRVGRLAAVWFSEVEGAPPACQPLQRDRRTPRLPRCGARARRCLPLSTVAAGGFCPLLCPLGRPRRRCTRSARCRGAHSPRDTVPGRVFPATRLHRRPRPPGSLSRDARSASVCLLGELRSPVHSARHRSARVERRPGMGLLCAHALSSPASSSSSISAISSGATRAIVSMPRSPWMPSNMSVLSTARRSAHAPQVAAYIEPESIESTPINIEQHTSGDQCGCSGSTACWRQLDWVHEALPHRGARTRRDRRLSRSSTARTPRASSPGTRRRGFVTTACGSPAASRARTPADRSNRDRPHGHGRYATTAKDLEAAPNQREAAITFPCIAGFTPTGLRI